MKKRSKFLMFMLVAMLVAGVFVVTGCDADDAVEEEPEEGEEVEVEESGEIVVAGKQYAEGLILGYMAAQIIEENTAMTVDTSMIGMGPTEMLHPALLEGDIDLYPEYTGTSWMVVLEEDELPDHDVIFDKVKEAYAEEFGLTVLEPLGFENTFAIAITEEKAEELGVSTLSELGEVDGLTFIGDSTTFTREDAYLGLENVYGFDMEQTVVDTAFFYEALEQGEGDVTTLFSTDGRLKEYGFVVLEDDQNFFPPYDAIYVARSDILEQYPSVEEALSPLFGLIDEETMIELNFQVEVEQRDAEDVAREFLEEQGLI